MATEPTKQATGCAPFTVSAVPVGPQDGRLVAAGRMVGEAAAARLTAALDRHLAAGRRYTRLDLSRVPMLDQAGFDVIVEGHHRFLAAGGTLVLTGISPRIARLLELTGLDRTLCTIVRPAAAAERPVPIARSARHRRAPAQPPEPAPVPATDRSDHDQVR